MTPDLVDVIAGRAADDHCDRESCGAGDCVHARNVEMLCEEWRDQRDEIARLRANDAGAVQGLKNLTASFEICDDCGANACDDAKPDGPHILCHDCAGKHKALHAERDALDARVGEANVEHAHLTERAVEAESARDAAVARAEQAEAERDTARWEPLEDYHKRHVPGCRKHMYDRKSSPCSCVVEYDRERVRADANERWANEKIAALAAAQAEIEHLRGKLEFNEKGARLVQAQKEQADHALETAQAERDAARATAQQDRELHDARSARRIKRIEALEAERDALAERLMWYDKAGGVAMSTRIHTMMRERDEARRVLHRAAEILEATEDRYTLNDLLVEIAAVLAQEEQP